jgi:hypothetical protein
MSQDQDDMMPVPSINPFNLNHGYYYEGRTEDIEALVAPSLIANRWHLGVSPRDGHGNVHSVTPVKPHRMLSFFREQLKFEPSAAAWHADVAKRCRYNPLGEKPNRPKDIYFIIHETIDPDGGRSTGKIKIGTADYPFLRFEQLQLMSPVRLRLVGTMQGGTITENELHRRFAHLRSHGEWFMPGLDLVRFINKRAEAWPPRDTEKDGYKIVEALAETFSDLFCPEGHPTP